MALGAARTSRPMASRTAAVPYVAIRRHGTVFSKAMRPATTAIHTTLMIPNAKSDAISAQQQPTHQAPFLVPICSRARPAVAPGPQERAERAAALAEADVLQRCELVRRGDDEGGAGSPSAGAVPGEHVAPDRVGRRP